MAGRKEEGISDKSKGAGKERSRSLENNENSPVGVEDRKQCLLKMVIVTEAEQKMAYIHNPSVPYCCVLLC